MILKRWLLKIGMLEVTWTWRDWMIGFGFDYGMFYIQLGALGITYAPDDSLGFSK